MNEIAKLSAAEYCKQAYGLIERRRFAQARILLGEAMRAYPGDASLLCESARIDYLTDELDEAIATVRQALASEPQHLDARYLLACIHEERGELVQCEAVLLDLLHDYPEAGMLYGRYALLMFRTFHIEKAKALAHEALRLDPEDELALAACVIADLIDGSPKTQRATLAELMRNHPENATTARLLLTHLISVGQYWAAKRIAIELLKAQPDSRENLQLVVQLEVLCHWTALPLWPLNRWGMAGSVGIFVGSLIVFNVIGRFVPGSSGAISTFVIGFMAYSWFYPPILKRWLSRRAGL
jgi:tetratricopeptide (TPR) repeat protein